MNPLARLQRHMTYVPLGVVPPVQMVLPAGEEVTVTTADGLALGAWWVAPADTAGGPPYPAVLVLHGNGGNRANRAPLAAALVERGLAVLLLDYRGYGGNPGAPSEPGLYADARAARQWLDRRADVGDVVVFGESLGAAVAVEVAAEDPPAALVLRSPFTSLPDVTRHHWPLVPAVAVAERYPVVDRIRAVDVPTLVVAGDADRIVPVAQSRRVAEAAGGDARLVVVAGAGHNDPALLDGPELLAAVDELVDCAVGS